MVAINDNIYLAFSLGNPLKKMWTRAGADKCPGNDVSQASRYLLRILSGAGRQGAALAASKRIRSKNERDSVHC